jgi:hypothetical protein
VAGDDICRGGGGGRKEGLVRAGAAAEGGAAADSSSDDSFSKTGKGGRGTVYRSKGEPGRFDAACMGRAADEAAAAAAAVDFEGPLSSSSEP